MLIFCEARVKKLKMVVARLLGTADTVVIWSKLDLRAAFIVRADEECACQRKCGPFLGTIFGKLLNKIAREKQVMPQSRHLAQASIQRLVSGYFGSFVDNVD